MVSQTLQSRLAMFDSSNAGQQHESTRKRSTFASHSHFTYHHPKENTRPVKTTISFSGDHHKVDATATPFRSTPSTAPAKPFAGPSENKPSWAAKQQSSIVTRPAELMHNERQVKKSSALSSEVDDDETSIDLGESLSVDDLDQESESASEDYASTRGNHLYSGYSSFTSFEEQMRIAREREQKRRNFQRQQKMNTSCASFLRSPQEDIPDKDSRQRPEPVRRTNRMHKGADGQELDQTRKSGMLYTGNQSFTSFDEQMRIARERERERRLQMGGVPLPKQAIGGSSLKDRMKAFQK